MIKKGTCLSFNNSLVFKLFHYVVQKFIVGVLTALSKEIQLPLSSNNIFLYKLRKWTTNKLLYKMKGKVVYY